MQHRWRQQCNKGWNSTMLHHLRQKVLLQHFQRQLSPFSEFSPCQTCRVCQAVPEAMLVRAHAASNCSAGSSSIERKATKRVSRPASMISCRGGLRSWESSFLRSQEKPFYISLVSSWLSLKLSFSLWTDPRSSLTWLPGSLGFGTLCSQSSRL